MNWPLAAFPSDLTEFRKIIIFFRKKTQYSMTSLYMIKSSRNKTTGFNYKYLHRRRTGGGKGEVPQAELLRGEFLSPPEDLAILTI